MNKLEKIFGLVVLIALIFKLLLITGGGLLLVISLSVLAVIYYPIGFAFFNQIGLKQIFKKDSYAGLSALKIIGAIAAGSALSIICIGILFKLQRWPGGQLNLIAGVITSLIVLVVSIIKYFKNNNNYYARIIKRTIIFGGFGLLLICLSDLTIVKIQYRNHPNYISAYEQYQSNPQDENLIKNLDIEYHRATLSPEDFEFYMNHFQN